MVTKLTFIEHLLCARSCCMLHVLHPPHDHYNNPMGQLPHFTNAETEAQKVR